MKRPYSSFASAALASVSVLAISAGAPANAQVFNWTGYYIGANAGGAWGSSDAVTNAPCTGTGFPPGYFCDATTGLANGAAVSAAGTGGMSGSGFVGGGQLGYNWQTGNMVLGAETDFGAFKIKASRQASANYAASTPGVSTTDIFTVGSSIDTDWLFTARGRLGWTFSNVLIYGTGGLALTQLHTSHFFFDNVAAGGFPGAAGGGSNSAGKVGWTLGGGLEWMVNKNWSVKAEYLHVNFGSVTVNSTVTHAAPINLGKSQAISTSTDLSAHIARLGVNYRF